MSMNVFQNLYLFLQSVFFETKKMKVKEVKFLFQFVHIFV